MACATCGYPEAIAAARRWATWDLKATAGPSLPMKPLAAAPPSGMALKNNLLSVSASGALSSVDLTGNSLYVAGDGVAFALNQAKMAHVGDGRLLAIGMNAAAQLKGSPHLTATDVAFDMTAQVNSFAAPCGNMNQAAGDFLRCRFENSPRDLLTWNDGPLHIDQCYFGAFGLNPKGTAALPDHLEMIHVFGGTGAISGSLFDVAASAGRIPPNGGLTGALFFEGYNSPIDMTLDGAVIAGTAALKLLYPIQATARYFDVTLTLKNCLIEKGSSGYIGPTAMNGHKLALIDAGGNTDLDTGAPINLSKTMG